MLGGGRADDRDHGLSRRPLGVLALLRVELERKSDIKKQNSNRIIVFLSFLIYSFLTRFDFPASGQAVVTGVVSSPPPRFLRSIFIAHRVQQSHCSSMFSSCVANSRSRALRKLICVQEKSQHECTRVCTRGDSNS